MDDALASLAARSTAPAGVKHAILEAACLVSACDGAGDEPERDAIRRAAAVLGAGSEEADAHVMLSRCLRLAENEAIKTELDRVNAA